MDGATTIALEGIVETAVTNASAHNQWYMKTDDRSDFHRKAINIVLQ